MEGGKRGKIGTTIISYSMKYNLKNELNKQEEQRQNHVCEEGSDGCQMGGDVGEWVQR